MYIFGEVDMKLTVFRECGGTIECELSVDLNGITHRRQHRVGSGREGDVVGVVGGPIPSIVVHSR